jgi:hypothetical protein
LGQALARGHLAERHGKLVAFYSDKHSVFWNVNASAARGDGMTQFGRALEALTIGIICAHSPKAKGRYEGADGSARLQDSPVNAMRIAGISAIKSNLGAIAGTYCFVNDAVGHRRNRL